MAFFDNQPHLDEQFLEDFLDVLVEGTCKRNQAMWKHADKAIPLNEVLDSLSNRQRRALIGTPRPTSKRVWRLSIWTRARLEDWLAEQGYNIFRDGQCTRVTI